MPDYHLKRLRELNVEARASLTALNRVADALKDAIAQSDAEIRALEHRLKQPEPARPSRVGPKQRRYYEAILALGGSPGGVWVEATAILNQLGEAPDAEHSMRRSLEAAQGRGHIEIKESRYRLLPAGLAALQ